MKNLKKFFNSKQAKSLLMFSLLFFAYTAVAYADAGLDKVAKEVDGWYSSFKSIGVTMTAIGAIVGGIVVGFKMKNAEGGEGKKALFAYMGGVLFIIIMWIVIDNIIKVQ